MFEVGFTEIVLILGIALLVLGPEKLPKVAADVGRWMGRARAMARQLKSQLDDEVQKAEQPFRDAERSFSGDDAPRTPPPAPGTATPGTPPPGSESPASPAPADEAAAADGGQPAADTPRKPDKPDAP